MASDGARIDVSCTPEFKATTELAARNKGMKTAPYVRQSIRLRTYLDEQGWTKRALDNARRLLDEGAWK